MKSEQSNITDAWKLYMYLLQCAIGEEEEDSNILREYHETDSRTLYQYANDNGQLLLLFPYIEKFEKSVQNTGIYKEYQLNSSRTLTKIVNEYKKYQVLREIVEKAEEKDIVLVFFKGIILADLYPNYTQRISCDTDIYVDRADKERACELLCELQYMYDEGHSNEEVSVYINRQAGHVIELHTCLWEDYEGRRLKVLEQMQLTDKNTFIKIKACGIEVTTLGYEQHLIYQMFHIIKHFSLQGVGMRYLVDITLYINRYREFINFDSFWDKMSLLGYAAFCRCFFSVCIKYLGMNAEIMQKHQVKAEEEEAELIDDLMNLGVTYKDKDAGWQILGMMTPYFTGDKKTKESSLLRKLSVIFPRARDLTDEYAYARKCPVLLPIAWIHKAIRYLVKYHRNRRNWYSVNEKLDAAEHRIDLMHKLGLLD